MHALVGAMLAVNMAIMQVVDVVTVQHRFVPAPWAVGVTVLFSLGVLRRRHDLSPLRRPSHAYMRSYEWQGIGWVVTIPPLIGTAAFALAGSTPGCAEASSLLPRAQCFEVTGPTAATSRPDGSKLLACFPCAK